MFAAGSLVAFEVDEIDYEWHNGWSVLIEGRIERVDDVEQLHRLHAAWPRPWVDGARNVVARVTPREITGRRLGPDATL